MKKNVKNINNNPDSWSFDNLSFQIRKLSHSALSKIRRRPTLLRQGLRANGLTLLPLALRPGLTLLLGILVTFIVQNPYASDVSAASVTLTLPEAISIDISPSPEGTFSKSDPASVAIKTDSSAGYTLMIKSKSSTDFTNGSSKLSTISNDLTEEAYKSAGNANTWGYLPSKLNGSDNSNFKPGPSTSGSIIEKTSTENANSANNYSFIFAAKADNTITTGIYLNTLVFTATANPELKTYSITYNLNSGSWSGTSPQTGSTSASSVKLDSNTPTRSGYEFKGWCSVSTSDDSCSGKTYQPGDDYNLTSNTNALTLWAMWKGKENSTASFRCSSLLSTGSTSTITDDRDGNTYTVAKLKDGNCWMTENLRLGDSKLTNRTLTSANTNITSNYTLPASSKSGFSDETTQNVYVGESYNSGYYTWDAATAGTGASISSGEASGSICPKGWRLPKSSEFRALSNAYGSSSSALRGSPVNLVPSGYYGSSSFSGGGRLGYYWSSTAHSSSFAYHLYLYPSGVTPAHNNGPRYYGYTIRCVSV